MPYCWRKTRLKCDGSWNPTRSATLLTDRGVGRSRQRGVASPKAFRTDERGDTAVRFEEAVDGAARVVERVAEVFHPQGGVREPLPQVFLHCDQRPVVDRRGDGVVDEPVDETEERVGHRRRFEDAASGEFVPQPLHGAGEQRTAAVPSDSASTR